MTKIIKRTKIFTLVLLLLEIIAYIVLFVMYELDFNGFQSQISGTAIFAIAFGLFLFDWIFFLISAIMIVKARTQIELSINNLFSDNIDNAVRFTGLGLVVVDEENEVIWVNEMMNEISIQLIGKDILDIFPKLRDLQNIYENATTVKVTTDDMTFDVSYLAASRLYFFRNVTDYTNLMTYSKEQSTVLGIITIDNYDEVKIEDDFTDVASQIKIRITEYFKKQGVLLRKFSTNSYLAICNYNSLSLMEDDGFSILDDVKELCKDNDEEYTLSVGFAHDFPNVLKLYEVANDSLEIAISRGGDQVVVSKYGSDLKFYGGKSEGTEKRNKVKVRVLANSLISLLKGAKNVFVMGHTDLDMDALGACLGIISLCDALKVPCNMVYNPKNVENKTRNAFASSFNKEEANRITITPREAVTKITSKTILVVVDVHRPSMVFSKELLEACGKVIVIDHHRRSDEFIENPIFTYMESGASSACEMITELIKFSSLNPGVEVDPAIATIMLAGIFLDTHYYKSPNTGARTFEASMSLKQFGADNITAYEFLKDGYEERILINKILSTMITPYTDVAIAMVEDDIVVDQAIIAKTSNEILQMKGVEASFVIGRVSETEVKISARSEGSINVQILCEKLGGGGHYSMASVIFKNENVNDVFAQLSDILKIYLDEARKAQSKEN